jgi:hypothetical protein
MAKRLGTVEIHYLGNYVNNSSGCGTKDDYLMYEWYGDVYPQRLNADSSYSVDLERRRSSGDVLVS